MTLCTFSRHPTTTPVWRPAVGLLLFAISPALGAQEWLPEVGRQQLSEQLADGLRHLEDFAQATPDQMNTAARNGVDQIAAKIVGMGAEGLLKAAPNYDQDLLVLPRSGEPIIDAIAAYGVCSLPLHPELATSPREQFYVRFGEVSTIIVSAALRDAFLHQGGTDEILRQKLASDEMNALSYEIQQSEALRNHVNEACGPFLGSLSE
jgi:hypothetical protein